MRQSGAAGQIRQFRLQYSGRSSDSHSGFRSAQRHQVSSPLGPSYFDDHGQCAEPSELRESGGEYQFARHGGNHQQSDQSADWGAQPARNRFRPSAEFLSGSLRRGFSRRAEELDGQRGGFPLEPFQYGLGYAERFHLQLDSGEIAGRQRTIPASLARIQIAAQRALK